MYMGNSGNSYPKSFKLKAVRRVLKGEDSPVVSRELSLGNGTLKSWINKYAEEVEESTERMRGQAEVARTARSQKIKANANAPEEGTGTELAVIGPAPTGGPVKQMTESIVFELRLERQRLTDMIEVMEAQLGKM